MGNLALFCFEFFLVWFVCFLLCNSTPNLCVKGSKIFFVKFTFFAKNYRMLIKKYSKLSQRIERNKRDLAMDDSRGSKGSKYFLGACATQPHQSKICPAVPVSKEGMDKARV